MQDAPTMECSTATEKELLVQWEDAHRHNSEQRETIRAKCILYNSVTREGKPQVGLMSKDGGQNTGFPWCHWLERHIPEESMSILCFCLCVFCNCSTMEYLWGEKGNIIFKYDNKEYWEQDSAKFNICEGQKVFLSSEERVLNHPEQRGKANRTS